jgi:hypothetical protein
LPDFTISSIIEQAGVLEISHLLMEYAGCSNFNRTDSARFQSLALIVDEQLRREGRLLPMAAAVIGAEFYVI